MSATRITLPDGRAVVYTNNPTDSLVCAYAQFVKKDWNTWDYETKYGHLKELIQAGEKPGTWRLYDILATEEP